MQLGSERTRIPSLKTNYQKNLEEKSKEVNDILRLIHTNNITETNNLVATCRSKNGTGTNEKKRRKIPDNSHSDQKPNQPPWKRCLEKQLTELRAEFSKLNEMSASRLHNLKVRKELNENYRIQDNGLNHIIDVKQRVKAKSHKIQRYTNWNKRYQQNKLFQTNQKRLLNQLRGEDAQQENPKAEPNKRLWEGIWGNSVTHNRQHGFRRSKKKKIK